MIFAKFRLNHHIGDVVEFETHYYKGIGEVRVLSNGKVGVLTEKFIFPYDEIKGIWVIK